MNVSLTLQQDLSSLSREHHSLNAVLKMVRDLIILLCIELKMRAIRLLMGRNVNENYTKIIIGVFSSHLEDRFITMSI